MKDRIWRFLPDSKHWQVLAFGRDFDYYEWDILPEL